MAGHSTEYTAALASAHWRWLRECVLSASGNRCQMCGLAFPPAALDLHHRHYRTLGRERPCDVQLLCYECHAQADARRAQL